MTLRAGRRVRDEVENEVEVGFEVGDEVEAQEIYFERGGFAGLKVSLQAKLKTKFALKKFTPAGRGAELRVERGTRKLLVAFLVSGL